MCDTNRADAVTTCADYADAATYAADYADAVGGLPGNETTLAEALLPLGYRTMAIGKWHLGYYNDTCAPWGRGFDSYVPPPHSRRRSDTRSAATAHAPAHQTVAPAKSLLLRWRSHP